MKKKNTTIIKFMSYNRHVIYYDTEFGKYLVAIKRNGTFNAFNTFDEAMDAIDKLTEVKR